MATVDPEQISLGAKVVGIVVGIFGGGVGLLRWTTKRKERREALLSAKVDRDMYDRHQEANAEQANKHHGAILDLYSKHEKTRDSIEELRKDTANGFEKMNATLHGIHADLLREIRK